LACRRRVVGPNGRAQTEACQRRSCEGPLKCLLPARKFPHDTGPIDVAFAPGVDDEAHERLYVFADRSGVEPAGTAAVNRSARAGNGSLWRASFGPALGYGTAGAGRARQSRQMDGKSEFDKQQAESKKSQRKIKNAREITLPPSLEWIPDVVLRGGRNDCIRFGALPTAAERPSRRRGPSTIPGGHGAGSSSAAFRVDRFQLFRFQPRSGPSISACFYSFCMRPDWARVPYCQREAC
jgi:hypothetical protein